MPWKNGQGTTTEIAVEPPEAGMDAPLLWRLSLADVATSGPFSAFPGLDRIIMLVQGIGMRLNFGDAAPSVLVDKPFQPVKFDGAWQTTCQLLGSPIVDFNLMVDQARLTSEAFIQRAGQTNLSLKPGSWLLAHGFLGQVKIKIGDAEEDQVGPQQTLILGPIQNQAQDLGMSGIATTISFIAALRPRD